MQDDQPLTRPGSDSKSGSPRPRRGISAALWGCLALLVILFIVGAGAIVLTVFTVGDDDRVQEIAADAMPTMTTVEALESPSSTPDEMATLRLETPTTELTSTPAVEPTATSTATPTTEATATPTTEPTATPTIELTAMPTIEPTVALTDTVPSEPDDNVIDAPGRLAVIDSRDRLWTIAPDGSDRRLLSEEGRFYQFPSWSPTGNDIAVIGSDIEGSGVYVVPDEEDGLLRQLYADPIWQPVYLYWSPQGDDISFIASHPDGLGLHLVPKDGAAASEVVDTSPSTFFWDWMPDGSQVLVHTGFTARGTDNSRLAFVPLEDGSESEEIIQHGYFQAPVVSADGRYFSFSDVDPTGNRWLSVRDIDLDQQVELIFHRGVVAMGFSPTGPQLAYISPERQEESFYGPLRLIDLESGETNQLVPETVLAFFWSPDGRSIAYLTLATVERPFEFDDAPVAQLPSSSLSEDTGHGADPSKESALAKARSQDDEEARIGLGLSVVDIESGETRLLTVFEPTTVFLNQFLPFFDQYALSHRLWSPDSSALVLPMEDEEDRAFIVVVPADGGPPLPIARGVAAFWSQR